MAQELPDYQKLYLEEQKKRQEAERRQEEERLGRENAERATEEERTRRENAERATENIAREKKKVDEKIRETTLPEFLNACHVHLHCSLSVQTDPKRSTKGNPSNADNKVRPERILAWDDFPRLQKAIWKELQQSSFVLERHFDSLNSLESYAKSVRLRFMSSELDLNHFERYTVEDHIASIIGRLHSSPSLREKFCLRGSVKFENHANTLSPEQSIDRDGQETNLPRKRPRRSPRLLAESKRIEPSDSLGRAQPSAVATDVKSVPSIRADQFCVYNVSSQAQDISHHIAAFIIEYKAPHKLSLSHIYNGLDDMSLEEVVRRRETESSQEVCRRLIAAAITQAFSYMIQAGLEFGYVCTGEAFIFLRVPDDPKTVYCYLSVPKGDVGETTGLESGLKENRLHLTAVGQVLAFTLQALKSRPRNQSWKDNALAQLKVWKVIYEDVLNEVSNKGIPSSDYRPPRQMGFIRMSPVQTRKKHISATLPGCYSPQDEEQYSDDEFDPDPDTPSGNHRQPTTQRFTQAPDPVGKASSARNSHQGKDMQYCTQKCLRGLVAGGLLDKTCPNARDHGERRHQIDQPTFLNLISQQLSKSLDIDCDPVGLHGAHGALFTVRLTSHGYTVAAKCTTVDFVPNVKWEAVIYERLRPIQGVHVPVYLGNIDLDRPYFYDGIAVIVHMMFMSFGGQYIFRHINPVNRSTLIQKAECSIRAVHRLGVLHHDAMPRNILWNANLGQAMIIDFERAEIQERRTSLGVIPANRKRKQKTKPKEQLFDFLREERLAMIELGAC